VTQIRNMSLNTVVILQVQLQIKLLIKTLILYIQDIYKMKIRRMIFFQAQHILVTAIGTKLILIVLQINMEVMILTLVNIVVVIIPIQVNIAVTMIILILVDIAVIMIILILVNIAVIMIILILVNIHQLLLIHLLQHINGLVLQVQINIQRMMTKEEIDLMMKEGIDSKKIEIDLKILGVDLMINIVHLLIYLMIDLKDLLGKLHSSKKEVGQKLVSMKMIIKVKLPLKF